ncbi:hypothetical protein B0H14DRAFT_2567777 [Mycena olivaceomarginata]|nr:hypothetical protein B0H14DRAFT_2567777 [Mycena olivaceomarginata]
MDLVLPLSLLLSFSPLALLFRCFYILLPFPAYSLPSLQQVPPSALDAEGTQCRTLRVVCLACAAYAASVLDNAFGRLGYEEREAAFGSGRGRGGKRGADGGGAVRWRRAIHDGDDCVYGGGTAGAAVPVCLWSEGASSWRQHRAVPLPGLGEIQRAAWGLQAPRSRARAVFHRFPSTAYVRMTWTLEDDLDERGRRILIWWCCPWPARETCRRRALGVQRVFGRAEEVLLARPRGPDPKRKLRIATGSARGRGLRARRGGARDAQQA